jgi:predicted amidophosphoribosyltransferase
MHQDVFTWNGIRLSKSKTITCRECGSTLKTIEESHLQGSKCTTQLSDRDAYRAKYPTEPVVTVAAYEGMTRTTIPRKERPK